MVEVFKTNVCETGQSLMLVRKLCSYFPDHRINFDLEDCDRILRVEGDEIGIEIIVGIVNSNGYECFVLE